MMLNRKQKTLLNLAAVLLLAFLIWAMSGYPLFSHEAELRRAERAYLLEPGEILASINTQGNGPEFLAADGGEVLKLCRMPKDGLLASYETGLYLYERQGGLTAVPLPSRFYGTGTGYYRSCMLVFDDMPQAMSAQLTFTVESETYFSEARREADGLFVFNFEGNHRSDTGAGLEEYNTLTSLQLSPEMAYCTVTLYDSGGNPLGEYPAPTGRLIAWPR